MDKMSFMQRKEYNSTPIPSLENITQSEIYKSMIQFDMFERSIVTPNFWLFAPQKLIGQYTGKKYEDFEDKDRVYKKNIEGLEFWYSNRGTSTKMIIIPEATSKLLQEMEETKDFRDYFENKVPIQLSNALEKAFIFSGIDVKYRRSGTKYRFQADKEIYVEISKIIKSQVYKQLEIDL